MATVISYIAFSAMAVVGFLIAYFSYDIYRMTRGGSRGWLYFACACMPLGIFAIWGVADTLLGMAFPYRLEVLLIMTGSCLFLFQLFMPLGIQRIGKDLGGLPKWYTQRKVLAALVGVYAILLGYNLVMPMSSLAGEMVSIIVFSLALISLVVGIGALSIARHTGKAAWWMIFIASIVMLLGLPGYQMYGDCCGSGWTSELTITNPDCAGFINDYAYAPVIQGSCIPALLPLANYSMIWIIVATLLYFVAFTLIWKDMKGA